MSKLKTVETETTNPLVSTLFNSDAEIRKARANRAVAGLQRQLVSKWNSTTAEFFKLQDEYESMLDLSPKSSVDLSVDLGDVSVLVDNLAKNTETRYKIIKFRLEPLRELMTQCFSSNEMEKYEIPTV